MEESKWRPYRKPITSSLRVMISSDGENNGISQRRPVPSWRRLMAFIQEVSDIKPASNDIFRRRLLGGMTSTKGGQKYLVAEY